MVESPFDIIIRNGTLVDGTGNPAFNADLAIRDDRIARIGNLEQYTGAREIDVTGLTVVPGFIDVHTHDDAAIIEHPRMMSKLTQGVTTVIGGNCGISGAPYAGTGDPPDLLRLVFKSDRCMAGTFGDYLRKADAALPAVNAAFLTGHTILRMQTMGGDLNRPATMSEIHSMRESLVHCLEEGSLGLSTGLFYPPARMSSTEEIVEIAKVLNGHQGIYATHMRDEGDGIVDSLQESLRVGREIGAPVIISHHKCLGRSNFGRSRETLAILDEARQRQPIAWDVYPYTAGSSILLEELVLRSERTVITWCDPYPEFCRLELTEVAHILRCTLSEAVTKLQPAGALYFMMDEADVIRIMCSSEAMIGSDGLPADQQPHPRLWGTFPRVLGRYVRDRQVLTLEDAVHRMTGLTAGHLGLRNRGTLAAGKYADLCIFDPQSIMDAATYEEPTRPAVGIRHVIVNGKFALEHGRPTQTRAGRILRRKEFADQSDSVVS